jgi:hypothetical protein
MHKQNQQVPFSEVRAYVMYAEIVRSPTNDRIAIPQGVVAPAIRREDPAKRCSIDNPAIAVQKRPHKARAPLAILLMIRVFVLFGFRQVDFSSSIEKIEKFSQELPYKSATL